MKFKLYFFYYLFVISLFVGITAPSLFSDGMFMDGLLYATIAKNMAQGLGVFWQPYLSAILAPEFYGHPPLAFGLQSVWFRVLGDSIYVERFYSLFTYFTVGFLIVLIWKELTNDYKTGWIPLLLWIFPSDVMWGCANNLLENTMAVFTTLSVLLLLKYQKKENFLLLVISGFALCLAVLTKGLVGLYVWGLPFFWWLVFRKESFLKLILNTAVLVGSTLLPFLLLFYFSQEANHYFTTYFNIQIIGSIQNGVTVDNRINIVFKFLKGIETPLIIGGLLCFTAYRMRFPIQLLKNNFRVSIPFLLLTLAGVFPIMISLKQRGFYILTIYPFFAIALAYFLLPVFKYLLSKTTLKYNMIFRVVSVLLGITAVTVSFFQFGRIGRDKKEIEDCYAIIARVGGNDTLNICPNLRNRWNVHGYFARYANVSLDANPTNKHSYFLTQGNCSSLNKTYKKVNINLKTFSLYKTDEK